VGGKGSGFTVMLDLALSVLELVKELKRETSSDRGIVTACKPAASSDPLGIKGTLQWARPIPHLRTSRTVGAIFAYQVISCS
jgi:hypothetical protein